MKKLFLLIIFTLGVVLAKPVVGNAYVISALGIKNTPNSVDYVSGDTSVSGNANYVLAPQVIVYQEGLSYVGSYTPFTGCLNSQHYTNGSPNGMCITGIVNDLTTGGTDKALSAEQGKVLNEKIESVKDSIRVNLLEPTLQTQTKNGITITNKGDGTYTLGGWADGLTTFIIDDSVKVIPGKQYRLTGGNTRVSLTIQDLSKNYEVDTGSGVNFTTTDSQVEVYIEIASETKLSNVTIKPMLTTDTEATSNDFISYDNSLAFNSNFTESYEIRKNAAYHNSIVRGKDITEYYTNGTLWDRIAGTNGFEPFEDLYLGDYFQMSRPISAYNQDQTYQTTGSDYVTIAAFNWYMDQGGGGEGVSVVNYNHIVCVPGKFEDGSFHFGRSRMNSSNTTSGAYLGSEMYTTTIGPVTNSGSTAANATINKQLYAEFGSHLKTTREISANSINNSYSNNFGGASNGTSNSWTWHSAQAILMSEMEVYGGTVWSSSGYDTGTAFAQLPLFALDRNTISNRSCWYWLKDVASASYFAGVDDYGHAYYGDAGYAGGYVRPRFILA